MSGRGNWLAGFAGGIAPTFVFVGLSLVGPVFGAPAQLPAFLTSGGPMLLGIATGVAILGAFGAMMVAIFKEDIGSKAFWLGVGAPGLIMAGFQGISSGANGGAAPPAESQARFGLAPAVLMAAERPWLPRQDTARAAGSVLVVNVMVPAEVRSARVVATGSSGRIIGADCRAGRCTLRLPRGDRYELASIVDGVRSNAVTVPGDSSGSAGRDTMALQLNVRNRGFLAGIARSVGMQVPRYSVSLTPP